MTTKQTISNWFDRAPENATHMIVWCDEYDWDDYPQYVSGVQELQSARQKHGTNMQRIMEIYNLSMNRDNQLNQHRAWNI